MIERKIMKTFKEFNNINESKINESTGSLKGVKEYRDGLTPETVMKQFPWLLKAKFKDAVIGLDRDGELAWYDGTWKGGSWELGTWKNGTWEYGIWKKGFWEKGTWEYGIWKKGIWEDGTWEDGTWKDGYWENGTWEKGTWEDGRWKKGTWKKGTWKDGKIADDSYNFTRSKNHPV